MTRTTLVLAALTIAAAQAQNRQAAGHPIGKATVQGNLILLELNEGALGKANMFDLNGRTIRFTPGEGGYRIENVPVVWDADFGAELTGAQAPLKSFEFPFSGKQWDSFSVGVTGSIAFGAQQATGGAGGGRGGRGGGVQVERFAQLQDAGHTLIGGVPAICAFFKPRMSGRRHFKETADRALVTWDLTEPVGGIQDFTWTPTVNRFQAVLHKDGVIELSYKEIAAKDAVIGVYPQIGGSEKELATVGDAKLSVVDGTLLRVTLPTRPDNAYRVSLGSNEWMVRGGGRGGMRAFGPGLSPAVTANGNTVSMQGTLPPGVKEGDTVQVSVNGGAAQAVKLAGIRNPEVHLSSVKRSDGPFPVAYEAFHYMALPNARDLTCSVITALGDKYDLLAYYSDFRVDNQEAGTPSNGPLGSTVGPVTGIGAEQRGLESYCSQGRFQWQFIQPVYVGSNQMQEYPPEGITDNNVHDVVAYANQLARRTTNGKIPPYDYAISQIGHEMGHRWSAFESAKINGQRVALGAGSHWVRGLQAVVPFPYQRPTEASAMGGGVWLDNFDGTYTQLDDDYYVPATGYSYLDLYNMGLIGPEEVPDFFLLQNLAPAGRDANGRPIFKADRSKVTIQDVIAVEGPRKPDVDHSQRQYNTGMVIVVEHGKKPSKELIERTNGIRERWIDYWATVTGHRSSMTANPK